MINKLLQDIIHYFEYLKQNYCYFVAFHNATIPLDNYMTQLSPYNINSNPYCLCVKTNDQAWTHCIKRQPKVFDKCKDGPFKGTCYAGMGEYVFPILETDGSVLGFIDLSGYCLDMQKSQSCIRRTAKEYGIPSAVLSESFTNNVIDPLYSIEQLHAHISPLCYMFILLNRELISLYGETPSTYDTRNYTLSHAIVYITRNYTLPLRVKDVAQACHCSVSYISHIFKKNTGYSVCDYVNKLRVKDVKKLLLSTNLSINQISEMVGYGSPNYMCETFKKSYGISPRDFRKSNEAVPDN